MTSSATLSVPILNHYRFEPAGYCIYCGTTNHLSDEHIMPFGLGGNLILPKASCSQCAKITSKFEMQVLRGPFRPVRVVRNIQSRRKHKGAPKKLPLRLRFKNQWETVKLPVSEYPIILHFFIFDKPGYFDSTGYVSGTRVRGNVTFSFGPKPHEVLAKFGADEIKIAQSYDPNSFARMTAKIMYSMAVAIQAINPKKGYPLIVQSILGEVDKIGQWVGTVTEPRQWVHDGLHFISIELSRQLDLLVGKVQYLANAGTPVYSVILGNTNDIYVSSEVVNNLGSIENLFKQRS